MIVQFSVSNFRSFDGEETFSFVASKRLMGQHDEHTVAIPNSDERVLRAGVLYGANGAGKSNLFKALHYLQWLALDTRRAAGTARVPFRFRQGKERATEFDLQFIAGGRLLRFGLVVDDERVAEEWLIEVVGGREREVYERVSSVEGKTEVQGKGLAECGPKVELMAKLGGKQHHTFLASVKSLVEATEILGPVVLALEWFGSGLVLIGPDERFGPLGSSLNRDPALKLFAGEFLRAASTGVDGIEVTRKEIAESVFEQMLTRGNQETLAAEVADRDFVVDRQNGLELVKEKGGFYEQEVLARHLTNGGEEALLRLQDESDGTQKLLHLVPALYDLKQRPAVYVIDEIDRSLHPMMVRHFVSSFLSACQGGMRQLLVTTHESRLLDLEILRRDEIWFAEKDGGLATRLYSLADFHVRKDLKVDKQYLQGRFGAIPFLSEVKDVAEEVEPVA